MPQDILAFRVEAKSQKPSGTFEVKGKQHSRYNYRVRFADPPQGFDKDGGWISVVDNADLSTGKLYSTDRTNCKSREYNGKTYWSIWGEITGEESGQSKLPSQAPAPEPEAQPPAPEVKPPSTMPAEGPRKTWEEKYKNQSTTTPATPDSRLSGHVNAAVEGYLMLMRAGLPPEVAGSIMVEILKKL